jgi:hypothetical protein
VKVPALKVTVGGVAAVVPPKRFAVAITGADPSVPAGVVTFQVLPVAPRLVPATPPNVTENGRKLAPSTGVDLPVVVPSPNSPEPFSPHAYTPDAVNAKEW